MAWINFNNGDTGLDIRTKLNTFLTTVDAFLTGNNKYDDVEKAKVTANVAGVAQNAADITAVEADVAQNTADIASNAPFVPTYDYTKGSAITVPSDVYTNILTLTTVARDAGIYKLTQSMLYSLNSTTTSAYFRFSIDGGTTWSEIRREPKDNLDVLPSAYTSTIVHTGGVFQVLIEARKENAGDTLAVGVMDVIFERKA